MAGVREGLAQQRIEAHPMHPVGRLCLSVRALHDRVGISCLRSGREQAVGFEVPGTPNRLGELFCHTGVSRNNDDGKSRPSAGLFKEHFLSAGPVKQDSNEVIGLWRGAHRNATLSEKLGFVLGRFKQMMFLEVLEKLF